MTAVDAALAAFEADRPPDEAGPERNGHQALSAADQIGNRLIDRPGLAALPKPEWQIKSWFPGGSLVVTYGKPGAGKTFFGIGVSCAVATGSWWHHCHVEQGPALYVAAEGASMFDARISAWEAENDREVHDLFVYPGAINLLEPKWAEALAEAAQRVGAAIVTVDTLNRCMTGDENSARDMGQFVAGCNRVQQIAGATVHVIHHDSRSGGNPRGSSALDGAADTVISLTASNGVITATQTKQKDAPEADPLTLTFAPHGISVALVDHLDTGSLDGPRLEVLRALIDCADTSGVSSSVWHRSVECQERTFYRARKWLVEHHYCHDISDTKRPRYAPTQAGTDLLLTLADKD